MTDLRSCTKVGLGFAVLAGLSASVVLGEGSELPDGSAMIGALPFADTGDTSDNFHDFDAVCPYTGSLAPDVFYTINSATAGAISISICESAYDTKLFVLDSGFAEVACNDDGCSDSNGNPFRSILDCVTLSGGDYHIAVDGWSTTDSGFYDILVEACEPPEPCIFEEGDCPPGALLEGEPCVEDLVDTVNGGCNSVPAVFSDAECGDTYCGEAWSSAAAGGRDTDWYRVQTNMQEVTISLIAEGNLIFGPIAGCPGEPDCSCVATIDPNVVVEPCVEGSITHMTTTNETWYFVGHSAFDGLPCGGENPGNDYVVNFACGFVPPTCCELGDANEDGSVDFNDLVILLANWGPCP